MHDHCPACGRSDDGVGVTAEWLKAVGFVVHRNGVALDLELKHLDGPWLYCSCNAPAMSPDWYFDDGRLIGCPDMPTRGHVRRLCAALGITLQEPKQ